MDGYETPMHVPDDVQRADAMIRLAAAIDMTDDTEASHLLLRAMDALLFTFNPKRGELVAFPGGKAS